MRISDWSSDVCSSDLLETALAGDAARALRMSASLCAEGDSVLALMGWVAGEVRRIAGYAAVAASGGDVGAAMRADRVWESRQSLYRRALQRHGASHWEGFVALCAQIDRIAKGDRKSTRLNSSH